MSGARVACGDAQRSDAGATLSRMKVLATIEIDVEVPEDVEPGELRQAVQDEIGHTGAVVVDVET